MRISARNQINGTVLDVKKGATTSHVRVDIGSGICRHLFNHQRIGGWRPAIFLGL
jgi:hypothetical protein